MANETDLTLRVARLEIDKDYSKKTLDDHTTSLTEIREDVAIIRSRMDGWNGSLPHIKDGLEALTKSFNEFKDKFIEKEIQKVEQTTESKVKVKVLWGIFIITISTVVAILVKLIGG